MKYRPTPFGLFAGVSPAYFGDETVLLRGEDHRAKPTVGAGWLDKVITSLESVPELRDRLRVVANNAVVVRGERLVVPHQPHPDGNGPAGIVSLHITGPLRVALDAARTPTTVAEVTAKVVAQFGDVAAAVSGMLAELVRYRVLITSLRAPSTSTDPLDHLLRVLNEAGAAEIPAVAEIVKTLENVHAVIIRSAHATQEDRDTAISHMRRVVSAPSALAVDLRLNRETVVSRQIGRVTEHAAGLLARLSPYPGGMPSWGDWRDRFVDRYGMGRLVPVLEVVHPDSGIGFPAGYPGSTAIDRVGNLGRRERGLLALAQSAALDGQREVELDQRLCDALAWSGEELGLPSQTELTVRVESASRAALDSGRFRIVILGASRSAGAITGRFTDLLGYREELTRLLARSAGELLPIQLSFPPLHQGSAHIARTPRLLDHVISISEHYCRGPGVLGLDDLAIGCDSSGLYLVAQSLGRKVQPMALHALNLRGHTPPLARFLIELPQAQCTVLTGFDWGPAAGLPFLPRLRTGRIVLSSARWRLDSNELPPKTATWAEWSRAWKEWAARRQVPTEVDLGDGDQRLRLDLSEQVHVVLLRRHVETHGYAALTEAPASGALGWCVGQPHELVVPLTSTDREDA
jgi:hypothetical protein